jgi:hypothetical protein
MDLKDFIKNTIFSISEAIIESQTELKDKGIIVNPEKMETGKTGEKLLRSNGWRYVQNLDFDILVGIDDKQGTGGKGELKVAGLFSIGGGINDENLTKNHNRIKFSVPVAFSTSKTPDEYKPERPSMDTY